MDTKETNELLDGIVEAVKAGKKIRDIVADGIDASDLPKAFDLVKEQSGKIEVYSAAAKDVSKVKEELKDLDKASRLKKIEELLLIREENFKTPPLSKLDEMAEALGKPTYELIKEDKSDEKTDT